MKHLKKLFIAVASLAISVTPCCLTNGGGDYEDDYYEEAASCK